MDHRHFYLGPGMIFYEGYHCICTLQSSPNSLHACIYAAYTTGNKHCWIGVTICCFDHAVISNGDGLETFSKSRFTSRNSLFTISNRTLNKCSGKVASVDFFNSIGYQSALVSLIVTAPVQITCTSAVTVVLDCESTESRIDTFVCKYVLQYSIF